jgi:hypothetical protein
MARQHKFVVLSTNIVVLARFHNPSILNPDFLRDRGIVPKSWKETEVLTTMPLSRVAFQKQNITILAEPERFQVQHQIVNDYPTQTPVCKIVKKFVQTLKHVNYTSLGLNWTIAHPKKNPDKWLVGRFIKTFKWGSKGSDFTDCDITLKFKTDKSINSFALSSGKIIIPDEEPYDAVKVDANAHYSGPFKAGEIARAVDTWKETQSYVQEQTNRLLTVRIP